MLAARLPRAEREALQLCVWGEVPWFLYHFRQSGTYVVTGYDADGTVVDSDQVTA